MTFEEAAFIWTNKIKAIKDNKVAETIFKFYTIFYPLTVTYLDGRKKKQINVPYVNK